MSVLRFLAMVPILVHMVRADQDGGTDPSVLGGDVKEFEKSSVDRLAHIFHEAASSVMKTLYTLLLLCMAFIAAAVCVRIRRAEAKRRSSRGGRADGDDMSKALMQYPTNTTDAGDGDGRPLAYYRAIAFRIVGRCVKTWDPAVIVASCDMYTHQHTSSEQRELEAEEGKSAIFRSDQKSAQGHPAVSTPPQSRKRPLGVTEGGLDIDFNSTAATPSTAATTRIMGDSVLRGDPRSVRLFREDSTASSIPPQTPRYVVKRLPPLSAALSPLPKLQASATTPTGEHAAYMADSRLVNEEEEEEAPMTPQRKPGSSRRSRSPSPPKIDKYRSRCRPMPCDGIPVRRLATEFERMLEEGEPSVATVIPMTPNFPALLELPRLTFLYSDEEESDEDLISPGSRLPRVPRINGEAAANAGPSTGRSTMVPEELEERGSHTPSSTGEGYSMPLKDALAADLEALFLEMDQYQIPSRVAARNLRSRSAQYAEVEDMNKILLEIVEEHPQQFCLKGNIIHFMQQPEGGGGLEE
ncbi:nucleolar gtp-binding protein [Perkinsus olseni]|uniref:Nucleolar gtp-binding protein n=1 Tax=Perkinsus olseni TaxID=32597 RepID=A0A7J6LFD2_PEROL|nr:nucleolar gtp-binding protein [Perkinsus olseni]